MCGRWRPCHRIPPSPAVPARPPSVLPSTDAVPSVPPIIPEPSPGFHVLAAPSASVSFPPANHDRLVTFDRQEFCYNFGPNRSGSMNLNLKRLFARSMTGGLDPAAPAAPPSPRSARQKATLITLAGVLAIVGALTGGYYFAMRPVTLRIAVGPAGSDDVKVVQTLTQAFAQTHGYVRLRPVQTDGAS